MFIPEKKTTGICLYYEYAQIRLDGQVTERNIRKAEVRIAERMSDIERVLPEAGELYRVEALRRKDHAIVRIMDKARITEVILALPDNTRFM